MSLVLDEASLDHSSAKEQYVQGWTLSVLLVHRSALTSCLFGPFMKENKPSSLGNL